MEPSMQQKAEASSSLFVAGSALPHPREEKQRAKKQRSKKQEARSKDAKTQRRTERKRQKAKSTARKRKPGEQPPANSRARRSLRVCLRCCLCICSSVHGAGCCSFLFPVCCCSADGDERMASAARVCDRDPRRSPRCVEAASPRCAVWIPRWPPRDGRRHAATLHATLQSAGRIPHVVDDRTRRRFCRSAFPFHVTTAR